MVYPQNFEQKTGFDKIREMLVDACLSAPGAERAREIAFSTSFEWIEEQLLQAEEFLHILEEADNFPDSFFYDLRASLHRIKPEGTFLDELEVFDQTFA